MVTNQRSILLQRAMRAEQARKIAEDDAACTKAALTEAHAAIRRLQAGAALAAQLTPATVPPPDGTAVTLVKTVRAVRREGNWHSPHTGEQILFDGGVYWLPVETENEL